MGLCFLLCSYIFILSTDFFFPEMYVMCEYVYYILYDTCTHTRFICKERVQHFSSFIDLRHFLQCMLLGHLQNV